MPTIGVPRTAGDPYTRPRRDELSRGDSPSAPINTRMRVSAKRDALTRSLAAGTDPSSSPELALRAIQLTSDRRRRELSRHGVESWPGASCSWRRPSSSLNRSSCRSPRYPPRVAGTDSGRVVSAIAGRASRAAGGGGMLGGFLNSGFGRAMEMGAGIGLGEDLINSIF